MAAQLRHAMAAQLRYALLPNPAVHCAGIRRIPTGILRLPNISLSFSSRHTSSTTAPPLRSRSSNPSLSQALTSSDPPVLGGGSSDNPPRGNGGSGGGGGGRGNDGTSGDHHHPDEPSDPSAPLELFLSGWRSRVAADPQFPFKVLMEQIVGVTACVLGDMASRPNFGLNELDFVFSTLVVGSILNFVLMYLLAPTATASSAAAALPSHMFEPGAYSLLARIGTFAYKGVTFAAVGFAAGLAGTMISNGLIALRKKMDPDFETPNKPPPTLLNSLTWALHMGLSSNIRYQTLNGVEYVLAKALPSAGFKASVVVLRCLNNVLGGVSFVMLARLTGAQKSGEEVEKGEEKERLVGDGEVAVSSAAEAEVGDGELQRGESHRSK